VHFELRNAFGNFGTGVVVIAIRDAAGNARGVTINSFSSVSLEPALLSWCLDNKSDMLEAFKQSQRFSVNVLAATQQDLSNRLAQPGDHLIAPEEYQIGAHATVLLHGALAHFECHCHDTLQVGDHFMFIGGIDGAHFCDEKRDPLLYFRGNYAAIDAKGAAK